MALKLFPWQREVIDSPARLVIVRGERQTGRSTLADVLFSNEWTLITGPAHYHDLSRRDTRQSKRLLLNTGQFAHHRFSGLGEMNLVVDDVFDLTLDWFIQIVRSPIRINRMVWLGGSNTFQEDLFTYALPRYMKRFGEPHFIDVRIEDTPLVFGEDAAKVRSMLHPNLEF